MPPISIPKHIQEEITACGFILTPDQIRDGIILPNIMETLLKRSEARMDKCPITDEPIQADSSILTPCGHYFSKKALDEWNTRNVTCPVCRAPFGRASVAHTFTYTYFSMEDVQRQPFELVFLYPLNPNLLVPLNPSP